MALSEALAWLRRNRNTDGSWGYLPGQGGRGEPTVLALAAGAADDPGWLETQAPDWSTLLLPAALSGLTGQEALVERIVTWTIEHRGKRVELSEEALESGLVTEDTRLQGWSWVPNTYSWVEPTCYALISLAAVGRSGEPCVDEARRLLYNRRCEDGGWNYGNAHALGKALDSFVPPTGWACLALPADPSLQTALDRLLEARRIRSPLALSLAILGRDAQGAPLEDLPELLLGLQGPEGDFARRTDWTALAACALTRVEEGFNVFRR